MHILALKRKLAAMAVVAGLSSAVFQPATCSVNVDPHVLQAAADWLSENLDEFRFGGNFHFSGQGGSGGNHDGMDDDHDDDGPNDQPDAGDDD